MKKTTANRPYFDKKTGRLYAFRDYCWYSWAEETKSMKRLSEYEFQWVLAGHGDRAWLSNQTVKRQMCDLVEEMQER